MKKISEKISSVVASPPVAQGEFVARCEQFLWERHGARCWLTPSATAGLELSMLALDLRPGDEVVIPSFSFPSCSNAVLLRGATPVYVDIDPLTLNLDPSLVFAALTPRTKALVALHYAGVSCDMGALRSLCSAHDIAIVEDAAQCVGAWSLTGDFGVLSFHATKNVECGEGGALFCSPQWVERVERLRNCGFIQGPKRWVEVGQSCLLGEPAARALWASLERVDELNEHRRRIWGLYSRRVKAVVKASVVGNGHIFWMLAFNRDGLIARLKAEGIAAASHYEAAHLCPPAVRARRSGSLVVSEHVASHIVRLPTDVSETEALRIVGVVNSLLIGESHETVTGKAGFDGRDSVADGLAQGNIRRVETASGEQVSPAR